MSAPATRKQLEFALKFMGDELDTMAALARVLLQRLEPADPDNMDDGHDATAWRLAQVLDERLSGVEFSNSMRSLVLGEV